MSRANRPQVRNSLLHGSFDKWSKSLPFHGKVTGSNPVGTTKVYTYYSLFRVSSLALTLYHIEEVKGVRNLVKHQSR